MSHALYGLAAAVPLALTAAFAVRVRAFCLRRGLLDEPGGRKRHRRPVPRLGGVAIFGGFVGFVLGGFALAPSVARVPALRAAFPDVVPALAEAWKVRTPLSGLLLGGTIVFLVGLVDDLLGERFPTWAKLAGQSAAALVAVGCGIRVDFAGHPVANALVSFLWIVGITNAVNFLDNMDGLAAGVAAISAAIFFANAVLLGEVFLALILAALIGSLLGFLRFNYPTASLFMGDGGALFLGFTLSSLTILEHYVGGASSSLFPVFMPPIVLAVPLLDTISVVYIRLRAGHPIYVGDRRHLSHRLVDAGLSERRAVELLYLVTLLLGLGALSLADASPIRSLWIAVNTTLMAALVLWCIRLAGPAGLGRTSPSRRPEEAAEGL